VKYRVAWKTEKRHQSRANIPFSGETNEENGHRDQNQAAAGGGVAMAASLGGVASISTAVSR